jgi:hypothetical protein
VNRISFLDFGNNALFMDIEQVVHEEHYLRSHDASETQGQLEISTAHTREAVDLIFAPFKVIRHLVQDTIGNGHDTYVLQKPANAAAAICMAIENAQDLAHDDTIAFELPFAGQDTFRVFVTAAHAGVHVARLEAVTTTILDGTIVHTQSTSLSRGKRFFGPCDFRPVEVGLTEPMTGQMRIEITIKWEGARPSLLHWFAPHAFSRPSG